ncbi:MAG: hypothetical protein ACYC61_08210 [Isosphaeraceae bacterium]
MTMSWRLGLLIGLMILASRTPVLGQSSAVTGDAGRGTSPPVATSPGARSAAATTRSMTPVPSRSTATAVAAARRRSDPSFNRVVTQGRASAYSASAARYAAAGAGPGASASGPANGYEANDPLRPYSLRAREAQSRASLGSTRTPPPQMIVPQRTAPPHNYYPTMRGSQHVNANVPQTRHRCTPSRGSVMAGGYGRGR